LAQTAEVHTGIRTSYLYINSTGAPAPFVLHVEDAYIDSLNYLHARAPKYWVVVHPHVRKRLERRLQECYKRRYDTATAADANIINIVDSRNDNSSVYRVLCSQFAWHMSAWVAVDVFERWEIRHTCFVQTPGPLVVTRTVGLTIGLERRVEYGRGHQLRQRPQRGAHP
jgi:hypothetical protein